MTDPKWSQNAPQSPKPKKRRWVKVAFVAVLAAVAIIVIVMVSSGGGGGYSKPTAPTKHTAPFKGTDQNPAQRDVGAVHVKNEGYGFYSATTTVTNHSSKTSDYVFTVAYLDSHGTRFAEDAGSATAVQPGETVNVTLGGTSGHTVPADYRVTDVQRTQSY